MSAPRRRRSKTSHRHPSSIRLKRVIYVGVYRALASVVPATVIFAFVAFWLGAAIYLFHLVAPVGWLSTNQLQDLKTILLSGATGAFVSTRVTKYLS
ncbi:MAG: hypothetical protein ACKVRO_12465 [Micropepsaceae bacterium]